MFGLDRIEYKSVEQIRVMRRAGLVVARALETVGEAIAAGVTTGELNVLAEQVIREHDAKPSFLGYEGFPASICVSVNDEVVHGIPGERVLLDGDVVSVDCGAIVNGWHADAAITIQIPDGTTETTALIDVTHESLWAGIKALGTAARLNEVSGAIEEVIEAAGTYGIVEDYVGHGIGSRMHQAPDVPNFRTRERGARVRPGLCIAIEPMVTLGLPATQVLEDDWTVVTDDGSVSAHWEHSVAVLEDGIFVLTAADGGRERLGDLISSAVE